MRAVALVAALLAAAPAVAASWVVDPARSAIRFGSEWNGQRIEGRFGSFRAAIRFDPANLAATDVTVTVDLASASTGDRSVDGALPGDDWFAVKAAATARFVTRDVRAAGPDRYVASGTLDLRGRRVPVELPFTLRIAGDTATMDGATRLDRRAFGIGMESDRAGTWVMFPVPVTVRIVARRAP